MDKGLLDLMICRIPGLNGRECIELQKKYDREDDFSALSKKDIEELFGRFLNSHSWTMPQIRSLAEKDAERASKRGIHWVSFRDSNYPPLLREIYHPPAILFFRGLLSNPEKPLAAIVGTRKPTSQAMARAFELGRELGEAGIAVVSGLALGIDSMAHRGNIHAGAPTIAVLGSGPDEVYPPSNRDLARRILETGGAILSEYFPGTGPRKWNFPARNRIISAMARGVVIVEAPERSGALITARFALEQDRDLWVDIAGVNSKRGEGTARLAEEGAPVISSAGDILKEWNLSGLEKNLPEQDKHNVSPAGNSGAGLASVMAEYLDIKL